MDEAAADEALKAIGEERGHRIAELAQVFRRDPQAMVERIEKCVDGIVDGFGKPLAKVHVQDGRIAMSQAFRMRLVELRCLTEALESVGDKYGPFWDCFEPSLPDLLSEWHLLGSQLFTGRAAIGETFLGLLDQIRVQLSDLKQAVAGRNTSDARNKSEKHLLADDDNTLCLAAARDHGSKFPSAAAFVRDYLEKHTKCNASQKALEQMLSRNCDTWKKRR